MQVIGLCRFSYPGIGGFQVMHETLEERIAYLYDPIRLEERFRLFETITLPPLRAQTDPDFTLLVVIGDNLPQHWHDRLMALVSDMPQVIVQAHPPARHRSMMAEAINSVRQFDGLPCLQFRMDDDDAVSITFVEKLRQAAVDVRRLSRRHRCIAINFNQGYYVSPSPGGLLAAPAFAPYTVGLGLMLKPSTKLCVMNFSHHKVVREMPTVTFSGEDMMIRGHNDFNDSRQKPGTKHLDLLPLSADDEAHFKTVFNIDSDHVRQVFSAP